MSGAPNPFKMFLAVTVGLVFSPIIFRIEKAVIYIKKKKIEREKAKTQQANDKND